VTVRDLPALNASLNAASALLLLAGYLLIRAGRREAHRRVMLAALACSALFLTSYLVYHFQVGSVPFRKTGAIRSVYFAILISHTILAVAIVPLVLVTTARALRQRFDSHRRIARWTLPLWGYVSVTGVIVYWMLYRL
jgi:putative membrane protein